ncbi:MAG TPA: EamA family transporter [Candidatus Methanoperedenaceae archaeon]|nr:EamA family transporter [Candidatus Methanoperedenaceae archaeon]
MLRGYGEIAAASVLFGLTGIFVKLIGGMSLYAVIFYRLLFSLAILACILLATGKRHELMPREKKPLLLLFGLLSGSTILTYFFAIRETTIATAVLLLYTSPIFVTLLSPLLLNERASGSGLLSLLVSMAGTVLVVNPWSNGTAIGVAGILFGVLSGVFYALQVIVSRRMSGIYSGYSQAFWGGAVAAVIFFPAALSTPLSAVRENLLLLVLFGLFPTAMAVSLYFNGLRYVKASSATIVGLVEPVSATLLAVIFMQESLSLVTVLGGMLILAGAAAVSREKAGTSRDQ